MLGIDRILSQHPTLRLDRWLSFAFASGKTASQSNQYETNARRIVTIWGPPVDDYSARIWSGLVGSYYLGRWKEYYKGRDSGKSADLSSWERKWVEENRVYKKWNSDFDLIDFSRKMIGLSQDISSADLLLNRPAMIGTWSLARNSSKDLLFNIPARMLVGLNGVSLECLKGKGDIEVTGLVLEADGKVIYSSSDRVLSDEGILNLKLEIPANVTANNGCVLKLI
jgi:alpha-N-acetylglucosaminidase